MVIVLVIVCELRNVWYDGHGLSYPCVAVAVVGVVFDFVFMMICVQGDHGMIVIVVIVLLVLVLVVVVSRFVHNFLVSCVIQL